MMHGWISVDPLPPLTNGRGVLKVEKDSNLPLEEDSNLPQKSSEEDSNLSQRNSEEDSKLSQT